MSSVDDRIVAMKFENKQFESGIATSLSSMEKLKQGMNFGGVAGTVQKSLGGISSMLSKFGVKNPFATSNAGLAELQGNANRFSTGTIEGGITGISKSWVAMSTIAITALSQVSAAAMQQAGALAANLGGINAVRDGWADYGLKINATQTIMAGTGDGIGFVTKQLKELDIYADQTIYSLSDMTSNISKFTNAGVDLKTSVAALKGVAQVAAVSGASSNEAARAMYNLGQAIGQGYVKLMDWKSVELANMGTIEFKQQLIDSAVAAGTLTEAGKGLYKTLDGTEVTTKNFSTTLEKAWLEADVLTETLGRYADKNTDIGKKAYKAATQVKTLGMMMETLQAAAGTGWTDTFELLVGDLPEATKMWTRASEAIGGVIARSADARNEVLADWDEFGGRSAMIKSVSNIWNALGGVLGPIKEAFRDIFPAKSGEDLANLTKRFRDFTASLIPGKDTMEGIRRTFAGVFAIFSIIGQVIGGVASMFGRLFGAIGEGSGSFLDFTGGIGDFLVSIDKMLKESGLIKAFFKGLGTVLAAPAALLQKVASLIGKLFSGFDPGASAQVKDTLDQVGDRLKPLTRMADAVKGAFKSLGRMIGEAMRGIGDAIAAAFASDGFDKALDVINTGLLAAIVLMLKRFMSGGLLNVDFGGGVLANIGESFGQLTATLKSMQAQIKADILIKIAAALAILTASLVVLSLIDPKKLNSALKAMAMGFVGLQAAMMALVTLINGFGAAKLPFIAAGLVGIAGAMLIMSVSLKILSSMKPEELTRGLVAMGGMMVIITKAVKPLAANAKGMIAAGIGLTAIAVALNVMAVALKRFAEMDYETMARGLAGAAGSLLVLAAGMRLMPKNILAQSVALVILSGALKVLANVVKAFASMDYETMKRGLMGVVSALVGIAGAMRLMPRGMLAQAAALVVVGAALQIIHNVAKKFAGMSYDDMKKAAIALGGALIIIAGGLHLMKGTLFGSAALVIAAGALAVIAPVLRVLGAMSWSAIAKGLTVLAGAFVILGVAGALLGPVTPVIIGLAASMVLIGAGFALAGVGALAVATAFGIFVTAGAAGIAVVKGLAEAVIKAMPKMMAGFAKGLVGMIRELGKAAPAMMNSLSKLLSSFLNMIIKNAPKMAQAFLAMLKAGLAVIVGAIPMIANAGLKLIVGLLNAINNNVGKIVPIAMSIVTKFINGVASKIGGVIQAGVNLIIKFVNGVADGIRNNSYAMGQAGGNLATAIVEGMVKGIMGGISSVTSAAKDLASSALKAAKSALGIKSPSKEFEKIGKFVDEGFEAGLVGGQDQVVGAMEDMAARLKDVAVEAAADVESLKDKLKDLKADKDPNNGAIAKVKKQLALAKELEEASKKAHETFVKGGAADQKSLAGYGKAYDALTEKIKEQKAALDALISARESEAASISSKFGSETDITGTEEDPVTPEEYAASLAAKTAATAKFAADLATLRGMGMDDDTYRMLLEEGLDAQPFIDQMLAGGAGMVQAIAGNSTSLNAAAGALGAQAAGDMHNAGIQAAQGLVTGLQADQEGIMEIMRKMARKMIKALKKELDINSPSREFATIGKFSNQGLAGGLTKYSGLAEKAAAGVGGSALDTLRASMSQVGNAVGGPVGYTMVVTPIIDMTQFEREEAMFRSRLGGRGRHEYGITAGFSYDQAYSVATIARAVNDAMAAQNAQNSAPRTVELTIDQTNVSPTALSAGDSYRNTKSAFNLAKEALERL